MRPVNKIGLQDGWKIRNQILRKDERFYRREKKRSDEKKGLPGSFHTLKEDHYEIKRSTGHIIRCKKENSNEETCFPILRLLQS
ncbi:hypothetical protein NPIL_160971 [Nephila pilipes]|uniref:Uncharacterized protein n=1 Tax=Nephila pilipes TaxID=299642 RepID=A0A8X6ND50_NEPPI|nr:hypothetical protein NPIL_160971 [Nephila pilipes]